MSPTDLAPLLKLSPGERAELAMVLWDSLSDDQRDTALTLDAVERAELDRRWEGHLADPASSVPWTEVRRKLRPES